MVGVVAVLLLALAVEPQCPTDRESCRLIHHPSMVYDYALERGDRAKDVMCNTTSWMVHDYCYLECPMRLVITDPPELRTWMCAMDNGFEPYAPDAHIDLYHMLNNKELDIEAVGHPDVGLTQHGCSEGDFAVGNKSFAGKIVLGRRGRCAYASKAQAAHSTGAAMLFIIDSWNYYTWRKIAGSTAGIETFPTLFSARHEADYILEALYRGVKVKGKFQYQCNSMPAGYLDKPQEYPWDRCPESKMALAQTCREVDSTQEPLCGVCTVELQLPGAEKLCLFGNQLRPRKEENLIHLSWDMPYTAQQDEVVYATELANRGCSVSDYAGLAGKILLVPETGRCTLVMTVRSAQAAGVKAYILVTSTWYLQWYRVRGYSHHVHIPVHTVDYHATPKLRDFVTGGGGRHIPGAGYALDAITFTRGEPPPTDPPTPAPLPPVVVDTGPQPDTSPEFEMSTGTVLCVVVVCVDAVVLAALFWRQRRTAVQLPAQVRVKTFSIPLKVASMGLSLTLLLLIAVVTFSLTHAAGQDSTDTAMQNGRAALGLAFASSERNTLELSTTIRQNTVNRVLLLLQKEVLEMEHRLRVVEDLFHGFDGTWEQFSARVLPTWRMQYNRDGTLEQVTPMVQTTRGFFIGSALKTDDRPDHERLDGVVGSVAETQEGWRYGITWWQRMYVSDGFSFQQHLPNYQINASRVVGANLGDPLAITASSPVGFTTWRTGRFADPSLLLPGNPIVAYRPLFGAGQYHGTVSVQNDINRFMDNAMKPSMPFVESGWSAGTTSSSDGLQNLSVALVDHADKAILGEHSLDGFTYKIVGYGWKGDFSVMFGVHTMYTHSSRVSNALANYLDEKDGWTEHAGEFDQSHYHRDNPLRTLIKVTASNGRVADTSQQKWDVGMRDGACGVCVAYDSQLQKEVLVFDGATTLYLYRNMTRRAPLVAESQVSGPGEPWRSKYEVFGETHTFSDGTECVSRRWNATASSSSVRCLLRPDISAEATFSVSMRIRPDVAYTETSPRATTPRLFSDTLVGEANVRLFANGQLYLFVLRYGCRTKAYEGGFPVGSWTTVTAVANPKFCGVFVNGSLYSAAPSARRALNPSPIYFVKTRPTVRVHGEPYRSGTHFKGRMDNLQLFDIDVSDDAEKLHETGNLERPMSSRVLFTETKTLDMNREQEREGVKWTVVVIVPRDDIMRVVDANRRETLSDVQIQEVNTQKKLTQRANATIMVIAAIAATSVVVFLVFNNMLTRPFEETAAIMAEAAVLHIDSIPQGTSLITEMCAMNTAIRMMLENLRLYKSFMPQSVQLSDSEMTVSTADHSLSSGKSSRMSNSSSKSLHPMAQQQAQLLCSLVTKRFSFLVLNVRRWHAHVASCSHASLIALHASMLDSVIIQCCKYKGVSEVFSGDRFTCSFNAAKPSGRHQTMSCLCALDCRSALHALSLDTSAAAVAGEGQVGNMGNESMRRFSFITPVLTWSHALERLCCSRDLPILVDAAVFIEVNLTMTLRLVDAVLFAKLTDKAIRVYEVLGQKKPSDADEWMYELEQAEQNDPMRQWNECASLVVNGVFEGPPDMHTVMTQSDSKSTARVVNAFVARQFTPFEMVLH